MENAEDLGRAYNYPHVAAHWVMYRLGRNYNYKNIDWKQSLENAYHTVKAMSEFPYIMHSLD